MYNIMFYWWKLLVQKYFYGQQILSIYLFILYFLQFLQILIGVDNKFLIDSTPLTIS